MRCALSIMLGWFAWTNTVVVHAGSDRVVRGQVVDASGEPAANVDVAHFWRGNGSPKDENGKPYDLATVQGQKAFWGNVGKMSPWGEKPVKTGSDGRFSISIPHNRHHLMAMDLVQRRGALAILSDDEAEEIKLRLAPLIRVKGSLEGPGAREKPEWCHVYASVPEEPALPLDVTRLASCGSFEARFEMSLPPGRYLLNAYTYKDESEENSEVVPDREINLTGKIAEVDLGVLHLSPFRPTIGTMTARAKAAGTWRDYTEQYGEKPPQWNVIDARGVKKDVQISDFKGKWVLVDFWGLTCSPCLRTGIPKLMKFYDEHQDQRDRFVLLAFCIDVDGKLKSISDLDEKLEPIIKHVWKKPLPFPVLLDSTFTTWERFGLPGLGTVILIDPDGKLVEGDETVLAEKLKE